MNFQHFARSSMRGLTRVTPIASQHGNAFNNRCISSLTTSFPSLAPSGLSRNLKHPLSSFNRSLHITIQDTPNPRSLKFVVDQKVLNEPDTFDFQSLEGASSSPLAVKLLELPGVTGVFLNQGFVSVTIGELMEWSDMEQPVRDTLTAFFESGEPAVNLTQVDEEQGEDEDSEVVGLIKELMETRIRPSVQVHTYNSL